ncbi:DMT family transporter [Methylotenera sp.]|uniref:DMT family transporter n=1 Tax=Methylotenera sp. TaxID=2051956 RepID=UPI0027364462|nr:DMT family transporter [Methylotenera sp.]MDP3211720.1 DMT family transporter [Methylotenera sp.]
MNKVSHPFQGVLLFVSALFLFACMDTTTKYLVTHYNVLLVIAIRYITHCILMIVLLAPSQGMKLLQTKRTGLVIVRGASLAIASLFMGLALQRMPVAETTAIVFLGPMLVVLFAGFFLGERIRLFGWVAAVIGFLGVLLIVHPDSGLDTTGTIYAFVVVGALVVYQLLSRVLVTTELTVAMLFYSAFIGSVAYGIFLPWSWHGPTPSLWEALLFLSMGMTGGIGHFLYTAAYRHSPASLLAPMNYLQLIWAGVLGWLVFNHVPDTLSMVGMCIIIMSGAIIAIKSRPIKF